MPRNIHVYSEIGALKRLIVHAPDEGIMRITPKRAEELLFDDIVHLPLMQQEYDTYRRVLQAFVGKENILEARDLLTGALAADEEYSSWVIERILEYEELPKSCGDAFRQMESETLARVLISGYWSEEDRYFFDPIPNFIFTRDIAVAVNDHIVITKAAKEARARENFLTRFIFWSNPLFKEVKQSGRLINLNDVDRFPPSRRGERVSMEGGDMMIINSDYLLIGCGERTTAHAIELLTEELFKRDVVTNVVRINIPIDRTFMHIDTLFTHISAEHLVAYKPIVMDGLGSNVEVRRSNGTLRYYPSIRDFFLNEINPHMQFISVGGGVSPYQEREQWTDAGNLLAVKPGVALSYDRNPYTEKAFEDFGYQIMPATDFLMQVEKGALKPQELEQTIITLPSSELSRGRGGTHCMSCPIERL